MASRGVNKVILMGNLGRDPEVRYTASGSAITSFSIATSETWKDKQTGEQQERTEWHRIVMFNRLAEIAAEYVKKGSKLYIEGKLRTRKWQDSNGQDRWTTEVVADEMQMLDSRGENSGQGGYNQDPGPMEQDYGSGDSVQKPSVKAPAQQQAAASPSAASPSSAQSFESFDDDIPF